MYLVDVEAPAAEAEQALNKNAPRSRRVKQERLIGFFNYKREVAVMQAAA
jgi:hypothetical protein